jgi:SAM-dependent methyltransferase
VYFDSFANRHEREKITSLGSKNELRLFEKQFAFVTNHIPTGSRVLEIGPGLGILASLFVETHYDYYAIESNEIMQTRLAQKGIKVQLASVPPIDHEKHTFDFVHSNAVIEHMPTFVDAISFLKECNRVLRPNGHLAIGFPDYVRAGIEFLNWDYSHSFITTERRINDLLRDCGFTPMKTLRLAGSISFFPLRLLLEICMIMVHSRLIYTVGTSCGFENLLYRLHKTFQPVSIIIASNSHI